MESPASQAQPGLQLCLPPPQESGGSSPRSWLGSTIPAVWALPAINQGVISRGRILLLCLTVRQICTLSTHEKVRKGLSGDEERAGCLQQIVPWVVMGYRLGIGNIVLRGKLAKRLLL